MNVKISRSKAPFFLAIFLLEWTTLRTHLFLAINGKSPTLLIMIPFVFFHLGIVYRKLGFSKWEAIATFTLLLELVEGIVVAAVNENYEGLIRFINGYMGVVIVYLGVKICYPFFSEKNFKTKIYKAMYNGCFWLTFFMGSLQLLYILTHSQFLYSIIKEMLWRVLSYLDYGKVQLFTEPSLFGEVVYLIFVPSFAYLYKNRIYKRSRLVVSFIIVFGINLMGISTRFLIDTVIYIILLCVAHIICGDKNEKIRNAAYIAVMLCMAMLVFYFDIFSLSSRNHAIERIHSILTTGTGLKNDGSGWLRMEYIRCAWKGFLQKPIWGWGAGNYSSALKLNYHSIAPNAIASKELAQAIQSNNMVSYSFIFTQLCESGLIGLINVFNVCFILIKMIRKSNGVVLCTTAMFMAYMFFQNEMIGCFSMAFLLAIFNYNSKCKNYYKCIDGGLILDSR